MKNLLNTIHGRINRRANQANKIKCFNLYTPSEGIFYWSFVNDEPVFEELRIVRYDYGTKIFYN